MKAEPIQVHWHDKQPVYSAAFHPHDPCFFVTAGGDHNIRFWRLSRAESREEALGAVKSPPVKFIGTLSRHLNRSIVFASPPVVSPVETLLIAILPAIPAHIGDYLASAGDGGTIVVWRRAGESARTTGLSALGSDSDADGPDTGYVMDRLLRLADLEDIYDLDWLSVGATADRLFLVAGLTDNSAQVWDVTAGRLVKVLKDHRHFVQGVACDPFGQFLVSESSDRSAKIWSIRGKANNPAHLIFSALGKLSRGGLFQDESCVSFFRRLSFSPDGTLLFLPTGLTSGGKPALHVCTRSSLNQPLPALTIGPFEKPVIAVRPCPRLFCRREGTAAVSDAKQFLRLPYRVVFAVLGMDFLAIFDTQHPGPLWQISGLHYAALTDVAWSCDGRMLLVTSVDGFCSLVEIGEDDLGGPPLGPEEQQSVVEGNRQKALASLPKKSHVELPLSASLLSPTIPISSEPDVAENAPSSAVHQLLPKKRVASTADIAFAYGP